MRPSFAIASSIPGHLFLTLTLIQWLAQVQQLAVAHVQPFSFLLLLLLRLLTRRNPCAGGLLLPATLLDQIGILYILRNPLDYPVVQIGILYISFISRTPCVRPELPEFPLLCFHSLRVPVRFVLSELFVVRLLLPKYSSWVKSYPFRRHHASSFSCSLCSRCFSNSNLKEWGFGGSGGSARATPGTCAPCDLPRSRRRTNRPPPRPPPPRPHHTTISISSSISRGFSSEGQSREQEASAQGPPHASGTDFQNM